MPFTVLKVKPGQRPGILPVSYFPAFLAFFYHQVKGILYLLVVCAYQPANLGVMRGNLHLRVNHKTTFVLFVAQQFAGYQL